MAQGFVQMVQPVVTEPEDLFGTWCTTCREVLGPGHVCRVRKVGSLLTSLHLCPECCVITEWILVCTWGGQAYTHRGDWLQQESSCLFVRDLYAHLLLVEGLAPVAGG